MSKRRESKHAQAIKKAKELSNGKCEICEVFGESPKEENLEGHHIFDYGFGGEADPENIIVLCPECHNKVHSGDIGIRKVYLYHRHKNTNSS